ncbi:CGNR zinc finger domain-containing protein [Sphaerisporangium corydalis]|uniref:CGNR zinc finger domain-containing protein n=1 Tax=Sphaerisporangium corydalis TaxID=1441875 RepID=A0ABV9EAE6_9ACTN|nr:CGNR zinc finger domain-containing protein [Sphaerisporangium corydalis]
MGASDSYIDRSRNRSRRFCSGACASRTTVAAHRARSRAR